MLFLAAGRSVGDQARRSPRHLEHGWRSLVVDDATSPFSDEEPGFNHHAAQLESVGLDEPVELVDGQAVQVDGTTVDSVLHHHHFLWRLGAAPFELAHPNRATPKDPDTGRARWAHGACRSGSCRAIAVGGALPFDRSCNRQQMVAKTNT